MGVYNRVHIDAPCRHCGEVGTRVVQIKFGECQLYDYRLGDSVRWASGRKALLNHGQPVQGRAWTPAYAEEPCPSCGTNSEFAEFAVVLRGDELVAAVQAPRGYSFAEDLDVVPLEDAESPSWRPDPSH